MNFISVSKSIAQKPSLSKRNKKNNLNQSKSVPKDTISKKYVQSIPDSLISKESKLDNVVNSQSSDSIVLDVINKSYHLFGNASVTYGNINLKADYIRLDWAKNEIYAYGTPDTSRTDKIKGRPIFSESGEKYISDTIRYNFKSKKAIVSNIVTQQGEGYVTGEQVKKDHANNLFLINGKYTTCNLAEPHFHIKANKIKLVGKKSLVSGKFNLVMRDIPLPLGLPFGFFPIPKKEEIGTSGFIMGSYGEEPNNRGFFFRDFGYYHAFNEYIGAKTLAQIYSNGSFGIGLQSTYLVKYRFGGNFNFQYNLNQSNAIIRSERKASRNRDFSFNWSHSPQSRRTDRSFGASVNVQTNNYARNNSNLNNLNQYTNSALSSSVQYSRRISKLVNTSSSLRIDQNTGTRVWNLSMNFNMGINQFNPFVKPENQLGKWYDSFRTGFNFNTIYALTNSLDQLTRSTTYTEYKIKGVTNQPISNEEARNIALGLDSTRRAILFSDRILVTENGGIVEKSLFFYNYSKLFSFTPSFSLPIALPNFKVAKYINITPGINLTPIISTKKYSYVDVDENDEVEVDTAGTFRPIFKYTGNISANTRIYGTFRFKESRKIQAIRHTLSPNISFGFSPDQTRSSTLYQNVKIKNDGTNRYLPLFEGLGTASGGTSAISFGLTNQVEAKVRTKSDTSRNTFEKVMLLQNLNLSGSYNFKSFDQTYYVGDQSLTGSFNLSTLNLSASSSLFKNLIDINFSGVLDPYAYVVDDENTNNKAGIRIPIFKWQAPSHDILKIYREVNSNSSSYGNYLSQFNIGLNTRISPKIWKKAENKTKTDDNSAKQAILDAMKRNPLEYLDFNIPWSVNITYSYNYNKQGLASSTSSQSIRFTGDFNLTPKWKFTYSTGYDFVFKQIALTNIGIVRDLHCWQFTFDWTPVSGNSFRSSTFNFVIRPKSSLLQDLKISKRSSYYYGGSY